MTAQAKPIILAQLIAATTMDIIGDALVRNRLAQRDLVAELPYFVAGALLLFGYGLTLTLAPIAFHKVVSYAAYRRIPGPPILVGGALITGGGLIVAFWQTGQPT